MAGPGSIGDAYVTVHADTSPFEPELERDLRAAAEKAEKESNKTGKKIGGDVSDGLDSELKRRGKGFSKSIEDGTKGTNIFVRSKVHFNKIRDNVRRSFRRDVGDAITDEVADAFDRASRKGGVFSRIGTAVADAVGAGFNVSGRSPLIAVLLPAIFALVGVFTALAQAINAAVAVLFIVPGLLASIGLQVGTVAFAFHGLGEAIQGAFAAKNAKELRLALKQLTPSARSFVKELLPLRDLFREISRTAQERLFSQIAGSITALRKALGPSLIKGFGELGSTVGKLLRAFADVLASPEFVQFLNKLFFVTSKWISDLSHSLFGKRGFLPALIKMSDTLLPFMSTFGEIVLRALDELSGLMFQLAANPTTSNWLSDMAATLQKVIDLAFNLGDFLFFLLAQLNAAGGQNLISVLSEALNQLSFFLASPAGRKALEGLVDLGIAGIKSFTGLIELLLTLLAVAEVVGEFLNNKFIPTSIQELKNMWIAIKIVGQAIVDFATFVGVWLSRIVGWIVHFFQILGGWISRARDWLLNFVRGVNDFLAQLIRRFGAIPGQLLAVAKNFGSLLYNAGRSLIQGLINGIFSKIDALRSAVSQIISTVGRFFPGSPAKEGPFSGRGYVKFRGQRMIRDFIEGIRNETPSLREATMNAVSNIVFGPNSVQVNVAGENPDVNRARTTGAAMGVAAADVIAARNTRLAVRTL